MIVRQRVFVAGCAIRLLADHARRADVDGLLDALLFRCNQQVNRPLHIDLFE